MNAWRILVVLVIVSLSACSSLSTDKRVVVEKARSIREFPVSRATLMASLGVGKRSGERFEGPVSNGWVICWETWQHPTGLTITAYGRDYRQDWNKRITRESIDEILNDQPRTPVDFIGQPSTAKPRDSFSGFTVKDGRRVVFQSDKS